MQRTVYLKPGAPSVNNLALSAITNRPSIGRGEAQRSKGGSARC